MGFNGLVVRIGVGFICKLGISVLFAQVRFSFTIAQMLKLIGHIVGLLCAMGGQLWAQCGLNGSNLGLMELTETVRMGF